MTQPGDLVERLRDGDVPVSRELNLEAASGVKVLEDARQDIVLAIAFLSRDAESDRLPATAKQLVEILAKRERILSALSASPALGGEEAEARIMREYQWGNLTRLGVANHLIRAGFRSEVAAEKANALAPLAVEAGAAPSPEASVGWLFENPDTGTEFSKNHPVESGECDDAQNVRPATAANLRDELLSAWQGWEESRAHAAKPVTPIVRAAIEFLRTPSLERLTVAGERLTREQVADRLAAPSPNTDGEKGEAVGYVLPDEIRYVKAGIEKAEARVAQIRSWHIDGDVALFTRPSSDQAVEALKEAREFINRNRPYTKSEYNEAIQLLAKIDSALAAAGVRADLSGGE